MAEPWRCPQCFTWIRADIAEHHCPPDGGVTVSLFPPPAAGPPATVAVHPWEQWNALTAAGGDGGDRRGGTFLAVQQVWTGLRSVKGARSELGQHPWGDRGPAA